MKILALVSLLGVVPFSLVSAASDLQTVTLDQKLQIPGATLKAGAYTFEIEDRLQDRAIIRITDSKKSSHELLLAVPNDKLNQPDRGKLILFPNASSDKQILQGWMCPSCETALEVVYPKGEAVKITAVSAKPVLAVDPSYDKLPKNLSADDMKVVTLWLLSPKEVTADQKGKGLEAAKWADVNTPKKTETASATPASTAADTSGTQSESQTTVAPTSPQSSPVAPQAGSEPAPVASATPSTPEAPAATPAPRPEVAPTAAAPVASEPAPATAAPTPTAAAPVEVASAAKPVGTRRMPHTASNTYAFGFAGLVFLLAGCGLQLQRRLAKAGSNQ